MESRSTSVTVLTEYFYPEEASTAQLLTDLATGLEERSEFDLDVITSYPNYHDGDRSTTVPQRETHEGVDIHRVRATRFDKDSLLRRVVNWLTFTLLSFVRLLLGRRDTDAVLVLSNPPILPFVAWLNNRLFGTPYVYLVYDVYPDMAVELGYLPADSVVERLWNWAMRLVYRDADRVVVLGESMRTHLSEKLADDPSFDSDKFVVIPNWEDGEFIRPMDKEENEFAATHGTRDTFTLVYSGNIGRFHELETAIDAIGELESRGRSDIQLLIIGEGARKAELQRYVRDQSIENVQFLPFQPMDRLPETLTCGDASLVGIKPEMEGMCVSSKLYSSLATGLPVLATVGPGDEVARVVRERECGAYVEPGDATAAADVLADWADNPEQTARLGANARECFEEAYTLDHALSRYETVFETVVSERAAN